MVRLVAILAPVMGTLALLGFHHLLGQGPGASLEARHLREMKDRLETPAALSPMTFAEFLALPAALSVGEYSGIERRAVAVEGRVRTLWRASDGDVHLGFYAGSSGDPDGEKRMITAEITPGWRGSVTAGTASARTGWGYEPLLSVFRPDHGGGTPWDGGPARVRISGWLLFDHDGDVLLRMLGRPLPVRDTEWEIHPVTKIERWNDLHADWVEVKR